MDGKGRYMDNIFVERLRSLKCEEVYLLCQRRRGQSRHRLLARLLDRLGREQCNGNFGANLAVRPMKAERLLSVQWGGLRWDESNGRVAP
jgi:hypothetical protein